MNKIDFTLVELLNALQAMEGIINVHPCIINLNSISGTETYPES